MATLEAINIQAEASIHRIEQRLNELLDSKDVALPKQYRDRDLMRRDQLDYIADCLEQISVAGEPVQDERLTKALVLLETGNWTKAQMEAVLQGK